ncbi:MAG TPA: hypothetical protein VJ343_00670 [archaeon]|nr:hypothetical protein [archaeon]
MRIKFLYIEDCSGWRKGLSALKEALRELKVVGKIQLVKIKNISDAKKHDFLGSPTIRINEAEVGREAWKIKKSGTELRELKPRASRRVYLFNGKVYGYPPKAMIKDFFKTYVVWKETDRASDNEGIKLK